MEKDNDDNDVPLGKMMKLLKCQGTKKKKAKAQTSNFDLRSKDEDVDVLGMVREINLDTIKAARSIEHGSQKRKRSEVSQATSSVVAPTPKRKRSSSIHRSPSSNLDKKQHVSLIESEFLLSSLPKIQSTSRRGKKKGDRSYTDEVSMIDMKVKSIPCILYHLMITLFYGSNDLFVSKFILVSERLYHRRLSQER